MMDLPRFARLPRAIAHLCGWIAVGLLLWACSAGTSGAESNVGSGASQGRRLFAEHCSSCHALTPGTILVGPSLSQIASRAAQNAPDSGARQYLEQSILTPNAQVVDGFPDVMPADFGGKLTQAELQALIDFLLTLE